MLLQCTFLLHSGQQTVPNENNLLTLEDIFGLSLKGIYILIIWTRYNYIPSFQMFISDSVEMLKEQIKCLKR